MERQNLALQRQVAALKDSKKERQDSLKSMKDAGPSELSDDDAMWAVGVHLMSPAFRNALIKENFGRIPNFCKLVPRYLVHGEHYQTNSAGKIYADGSVVKKNEFSFVFFNTEANPTWEYHHCFCKSFNK